MAQEKNEDFEPKEQTLNKEEVDHQPEGFETCKLTKNHESKCCLVTGLSKATTRDALMFYFENPRNGCGEEPSQVELDEISGQAWVHFTNSSALEKLHKKKHILDGAELKIEPVYSFLAQDVCTKKIDVHPEIMAYIKTYYEEEFQTVLDENALELQWKANETSALIISGNSAVRDEKASVGVNRVEHLQEFLEDFEYKTFTVESDLFKEIANDLQRQIEAERGAEKFECSLDESRSTVSIVGKKESTVETAKKMENLIGTVTREWRLKESVIVHNEGDLRSGQLAVLEKSDLLDVLQDSYKYTKIDIIEGNVVIHSPESTIQEVIAEVLRFVAKVDKDVIRLSERILDVFFSTKGRQYLSNAFKSESLNASLVREEDQKTRNEATVYARNSDECRKAVELIHSFAKEKFVRLKDESMKVVKDRKWKELLDKLQDEFLAQISQDKIHVETFWISGVEKDVIKCYEHVNEHIDKYTIFHDCVEISQGNLKFLFKVWSDKVEEITEELKESFLKMKPNYKELKIEITGNQNGIHVGKERLSSCVKKILSEEVKVDKPGMGKFFKSRQGLMHLENVEREHSCTIEVMEGKDHLVLQDISTSSENFEALCSVTTPEGKTISVCKDDLTKHPVDVIVNAANAKLRHTGGLAGSILRAGGQQIQEECDKYIRDNGDLQTGEVIDTDSGVLPCKRIVHAVGPRWDTIAKQKHAKGQKTIQEELLYKAIQNSLSFAKDYQSIAIPAISSGIFGVPVDLCARTIIQSTIDFLKLHPHCRLSDIRFTNYDDQTVHVFQDEMNTAFGNGNTESNFGDSAKALPRSASRTEPDKEEVVATVSPAIVSNNSAFVTPEGVSISIKVGDIANEKSDVLVNTAGSHLNLQNNNCAKAFSKAAGPQLQSFCDAIAPVNVGDVGITLPAKLKCKRVFHAVCGEWNNGGGLKVLCSLIEKCLKKAENLSASSISIPAIGTGVLGFPHDVVARTSFDEVIKFSRNCKTNCLKEVRFVVYHRDQASVQTFQDELNQRRRSAIRQNLSSNSTNSNVTSPKRNQVPHIPKPIGKKPSDDSATNTMSNGQSTQRDSVVSIQAPQVKTRKPKLYEIKMGKVTVQVEKGDITEEKTNAIGMFSNPILDFDNQGPAWAAVMKSDGAAIERERYRLRHELSIKPGHCVVFPTNHLQVGNLVVCSNNSKKQKTFQSNIVACLKTAETHELKSISFPDLGTGILGLSSKDCADFMLSATRKFSKTQPKSIQLIRIVVFHDDMIIDFVDAMRKYAYSKKSFWKVVRRGAKNVRKYLKKQIKTEHSGSSQLNLHVYGGNQKSLASAIRAINDIMIDKCVLQEIAAKESIFDIDESHMSNISVLEQQLDCRINVEKDNCTITVEGLSDDVLEATQAIHDMLLKITEAKHERTKAESIAKDAQWEYQTDEAFTPYSVDANAKIETAFGNKEEDVTFEENGQEFTINFADMRERSVVEVVQGHTNVRRKELRLGGIRIPDHWDNQPRSSNGVEKAVHLVNLDPASNEFSDVETQFVKSCPKTILKISRIQNPEQYKIYSIKKQRMDEGSGSNEKQLFHGTASENCENINQKGFNRSYCGKNAIVYGAGVYFAVNAAYSARDTYSPADANGNRYIYLARVLTGEYTLGDRTMKEPPPKNPVRPNITYDTVVDNISNPNIFVVFYDGQAYPEYLIEFK